MADIFSLSLAAARINAGMTQVEAADNLGVGINSIVNWEKGHVRPSAETIADLASLYKAPVEFLMNHFNRDKAKDEGSLGPWTKIVIETDSDKPITIAVITPEDVNAADGYRVRLTPKYD